MFPTQARTLFTHRKFLLINGIALVISLIALPTLSDPVRRGGGRAAGGREHGYSGHGEYLRLHDRGRIRQGPYYYRGGHFYFLEPRGHFYLVAPPFGFVVSFLPFGAVELAIGPSFYYFYDGIYYRSVPEGYEIVRKPRKQPVEVDDDQGTVKPFKEPMADTVEVKNSNGSVSPVRLEKTDDGKWMGPRGELYDSLPSQEQLRPVYGF